MTKFCKQCRKHQSEGKFIEYMGSQEIEHDKCDDCRNLEYARDFEENMEGAESVDEKVCPKCLKSLDRRAFINPKSGIEYRNCKNCNFKAWRAKQVNWKKVRQGMGL